MIKKIVARFDKKQRHGEKRALMKKTADPEEDSITENSKRTLGLRTIKRILSMKKPKRTISLLHL